MELFGSSLEFPGRDLVLPGGLDGVAALLAGDLPAGAVKLRHEVRHIDYSDGGGGVTVEVDDVGTGNSYRMEAEHVICTIPIGVLKRNHLRMFSPHLSPNKVSTCSLTTQ